MLKGYCSVEEIENYTLTEIESGFETQIESWIETAEAIIDRRTGRNFILEDDAEDEVRYFDGNGKEEMYIDECLEITSVEILDTDGTILYTLELDTHCYGYPYNSQPMRKLIVAPGNPLISVFNSGIRNIKITGQFGYSSTVPKQINFATMVLASGIMNFSNHADGEIKSEKIGDYSVSYKDDQWKDFELAKEIIEEFTKQNVV